MLNKWVYQQECSNITVKGKKLSQNKLYQEKEEHTHKKEIIVVFVWLDKLFD